MLNSGYIQIHKNLSTILNLLNFVSLKNYLSYLYFQFNCLKVYVAFIFLIRIFCYLNIGVNLMFALALDAHSFFFFLYLVGYFTLWT